MSEAAPKSGEYQEGKLWFQRRGTLVTLGLTSSAIEELGDLDELELPEEGGDIAKGDVVFTVEGSRGKIEACAPATGTIEAINRAARQEPDVVIEDPFEEGWLIKLEIEDETELQELG